VSSFVESVVEDATLTWLQRLGYQVLYGAAVDAGRSRLTAWQRARRRANLI
jgi:hypothetical protein